MQARSANCTRNYRGGMLNEAAALACGSRAFDGLDNRIVQLGRTSRMGCELRSGQVRLVSSVTERWRFGSIHSEVPVNPRCP